ncbi:MAG: hypothetical protein ACE5I1_10995 [bacterium]
MMEKESQQPQNAFVLSSQDLLAGSKIVHEINVPDDILYPGEKKSTNHTDSQLVRLRPLTIHTLALISRAAREDAGLVPLLMIKESLMEPNVSIDQVKQMHVGLVHFLVAQINRISGLESEEGAIDGAANAPLGRAQILLAKHFGWTPEQVSQLTPGQVAVYLAGIEKLLELENTKSE